MPTRKVLLIVLVVYILVVFIPIVGYLYFSNHTKSVSNSTEKIRETSESTSTAFEQFVKPKTTSSTNKLFDPTNWRSGQFESIDGNTVDISLPNDEKGTLIKKSYTFTDDTLLLCSINKIKDVNGTEIDASKVFANFNKMTDVAYAEFIKIYKDIPANERLAELKDYKAGSPIHYGITSDKDSNLLWVRIFKEDCGKFSSSIYD